MIKVKLVNQLLDAGSFRITPGEQAHIFTPAVLDRLGGEFSVIHQPNLPVNAGVFFADIFKACLNIQSGFNVTLGTGPLVKFTFD